MENVQNTACSDPGHMGRGRETPEDWESMEIMELFSQAFCGYFHTAERGTGALRSRQTYHEKMKYIVAEFPALLQDFRRSGADVKMHAGGFTEAEQDCCKLAAVLADVYYMPQTAALAVIMPAWCKYMLQQDLTGLVDFARQVWNVQEKNISDIAMAQEGIARFQDFICKCGMAVTMREYGIRYFDSRKVAEKAAETYESFETMKNLAEIQAVYELARG